MLTPLAECRTLSAAPVPRPPQPIRPTLIASLPAACALFSRPRPIVAAVEPRRKSRRVAEDPLGEVGSVMVRLLVLSVMDSGRPPRPRPARSGIEAAVWVQPTHASLGQPVGRAERRPAPPTLQAVLPDRCSAGALALD